MKNLLSEQNELYLFGVWQYKEKNFETALNFFEECEKYKEKPNANLYICESKIYEKIGKIKEAEAALRKGIEAGHDALWYSLGLLKMRHSNNPKDCIDTLLEGAKAGSEHSLYQLQYIYANDKRYLDYKKSLEYADKIIKEKTYHGPAEVARLKAIALKNIGKYDESIELLEELFKLGMRQAGDELLELYSGKNTPVMDMNKALDVALRMSEGSDVFAAEILLHGSNHPDRFVAARSFLETPFYQNNFRAICDTVFISIITDCDQVAIFKGIDHILSQVKNYKAEDLKNLFLKRLAYTNEEVTKVEEIFDKYIQSKGKIVA